LGVARLARRVQFHPCWGNGNMAPNRLLDALESEIASMAEYITDLEQRQADIRQQLADARALRSELIATADALNRERLR
jgi:hypothetical protein